MRPDKQRPMEVFAESGSSSSSSDESENEAEDSTPQVKNEIKEEVQEEEQEEEQEEQEEEQEQHETAATATTTTTTTTTPPEKEEEELENAPGNLFDSEDKVDEEEDAEFDGAVKEETTTTTTDNNNALFGEQDDDDDDDDDAEFDDTGVKGSSRRPDDEEMEEKMEYQSDVDSADEIEELRSRTLEALDYPKPTKSTMHMTKLPNILNINPNAFDVSTFNADEEEKEYSGNVHSLIRWRYKTDPATGEFIRDENNRLVRESNARFVRWSDGSLTLHVNEESFDIDEMKMKSKPPEKDKEQNVESGNGIFPGLNGYLYISQEAWNKGKEQTIFKGLGPITSKLNARPSSINSEAHRNLTLAVRQKNFKKARIEEFNVIQDPEKEKNKRIKNKDDLFKSENRSSSSYSRTTNRSSNSGYNQRRRNKYSMEERNYDSVNIGALKRMNEDMMNVEESGVYDYGSAGSASDDDWEQKKLLDFKKARKGERKVVNEEEEEENLNQEDSDDDEEGKMMSQRRNRSRAVVDEDDED